MLPAHEKQSKTGRSGVVMWYGAENPVEYYRPSLHMPFDKEVSSEKRIDTLLSWMTLHENPVTLGLLYFSEPDDTGHKYGASSTEITDMVSKINHILDYLFKRLEEKHILDDVNIIFTSDHGMVDVSSNKTIVIDQIEGIEPWKISVLSTSPVASIYPLEGKNT